MKRLVQGTVLVAIICCIFSCKKEENPVYDLSILINGTNTLLHNAACRLAPDSLDPSKTDFRLTASTFNGSQALTVDIHKNDLNFPATDYTSGSAGYTVLVNYYEDINSPSITQYSLANAPGNGTSEYVISFTEITSNYVRGTITGNYLTNTFSGNNETVEVTGGSFYALRVYK